MPTPRDRKKSQQSAAGEASDPALELAKASVPSTAQQKVRRRRVRTTAAARALVPARHADGIPLRHLVDAPKANPAWRPGQPLTRDYSRLPGRPKERTFEEDARDILNHGVPTKLRALVALRTGLSFDIAAVMSLRQAVILLMINDAVEKGQLDKLDRILDRTDPKSRRVEHRGNVGHLHALAGQVLNMTEADAAEVYRQMAQGVIEAEIVSEGGSKAD